MPKQSLTPMLHRVMMMLFMVRRLLALSQARKKTIRPSPLKPLILCHSLKYPRKQIHKRDKPHYQRYDFYEGCEFHVASFYILSEAKNLNAK
jgi:hypothetical protein